MDNDNGSLTACKLAGCCHPLCVAESTPDHKGVRFASQLVHRVVCLAVCPSPTATLGTQSLIRVGIRHGRARQWCRPHGSASWTRRGCVGTEGRGINGWAAVGACLRNGVNLVLHPHAARSHDTNDQLHSALPCNELVPCRADARYARHAVAFMSVEMLQSGGCVDELSTDSACSRCEGTHMRSIPARPCVAPASTTTARPNRTRWPL